MPLKHQPIGNYAWMVIIRGSGLPDKTKLVALILATYADSDGSGACVGQERLADEAICDERYARDCLSILEVHGLIEVTRRGRRGGDADTYQLTTPGFLCPRLPKRRDPNGRRVDDDLLPFDGKRPMPLSVRPYLAAITGTPVPVREMPVFERGGTGVPVQDATGPVENHEYRHPSAGTGTQEPGPYRHWGPSVPALGATSTGTPVPPTNSYQLLPTNSPQVTNSPAAPLADVDNPESITETYDLYEAAHAVLAGLRPAEADHWRRAARVELEAAGVRLDRHAVEVRAAEIATRPDLVAAHAELDREMNAYLADPTKTGT